MPEHGLLVEGALGINPERGECRLLVGDRLKVLPPTLGETLIHPPPPGAPSEAWVSTESTTPLKLDPGMKTESGTSPSRRVLIQSHCKPFGSAWDRVITYSFPSASASSSA